MRTIDGRDTACAHNAACFSRHEVVDHYRSVVSERLYPFEERFIHNAGVVIEDAQVLDLGCGAGREAIALATLGAHVTAVDVSRPMLREAKIAARAARMNVELVLSDCLRLRYAANRFDLILGTHNFISHVLTRDMRVQFMKRCARWLKKSGRMILTYHNRRGIWHGREYWRGERRRASQLTEKFGLVAEYGDMLVRPSDRPSYSGPDLVMHLFSHRGFDAEIAAADMKTVLRRCITTLCAPSTQVPWSRTVTFVACARS